MQNLLQDLRYAVRMLTRRPSFTCIAVVTLALGIGANTAIFSVIDAVLLQPLSYEDPERIIRIWGTDENRGTDHRPLSGPDFVDWRAQNQVFEQMAAFDAWAPNLTGLGDPERLNAARISPGFFSILGVQPMTGREFSMAEELPGQSNVVIMHHRFWQQAFNGDPEVLGQSITLNNQPFTIIGVMSADFQVPPLFGMNAGEPDIWVPFVIRSDASRSGRSVEGAIGKLKPGMTLMQAQSDMSTIAERLEAEYPRANAGNGINLVPLFDQIVGETRPTLYILFAAVGFVLLIACANVANLLLARATGRSREMAIRNALGAGRWRIVRQLLTESVLLSLVGGGLGLLLAIWATDMLVALSAGTIPRLENLGFNVQILGFTLCIAMMAGIVFGLAPALQSASPNLNEGLKDGDRGSTAGGLRQRLRSLLIIGEVAVSLVLLIGAGLLIKSFIALNDVEAGFNPDNLLATNVYIPQTVYSERHQQIAFYDQIVEEVRSQPGVESASVVSVLPLSDNFDRTNIHIEGTPEPPPGQAPSVDRYVVNLDYFRTMEIPLISGRTYNAQDHYENQPVVIISETMAHRLWPGEDPVGKRIRIGPPRNPWRTIVGIVGDVKQYGLDTDGTMQIYLHHQQYAWPWMTLVARTAGDPSGFINTMRRQVLAVDAAQPIFNTATMEQLMATSIAQRRFTMVLLGIFASVALVLASIGIYGVMSYAVSQRIHEIGIRMAVGARSSDILKLMVGQGMGMVAIGVALGLAASFALTRVLASLLFGVTATDPITYLSLALFLMVIALLSILIPARRATKVDPMLALRYE